MFCTSLRQRQAVSSTIPQLQELGLRESHLKTHDFLIPIKSQQPSSTGKTTRTIRFLLLSSSDMSDSLSSQLRDRLQHFAAITGGQNLAICFLLASEIEGTHFHQSSTPACGLQAYTKLQCILTVESELPTLPVLLCANAGDVGATVKAHIESLVSYQPGPPLPHPGNLLAGCTIGPYMSSAEVSSVASLFGNIGNLASACVASAEQSQSNGLMELTAEDRTSIMRLEALRRQIGDERARGILGFWTS